MASWMLLSCLSVPVCGENVEVMERLTYFGHDIHVSACCGPEVNRCLGQASGVKDSQGWGVALPVPVWEGECLSLQVLDASSFALWM